MSRLALVLITLVFTGCAAARSSTPDAAAVVEAALLELSDSVFAAARARDADRFASHFSDRQDFVYLINTRRITSRDSLRTVFANMLQRQRRFEPRWVSRNVQVLTSLAGVLTGEFETQARRTNGESWQARGVVTFAATRGRDGWRIVNWHTTE